MSSFHLEHLFSATSVVAVGRFGSCAAPLRALLGNLGSSRVDGPVVVDLDGGPRPRELDGRVGWVSRIDQAPTAPDLLVSALSLSETPALLTAAREIGARSIILTRRAEAADAPGAEQRVKLQAREASIRLLGFGSQGVIVPALGLNASTFDVQPSAGNLALVSQSGALVSTILDMAHQRRIGFSHVVSLGSLCDVDFGDAIDYLAGEARVRCVLLYVENITSVKKFLSACRSAARVKPLVAIKGGRSAIGRQLIAQHTGKVAGEDRVYDTAFRRAGVIRVETIRELLSSGEALGRGSLPPGDRLAIVTNSGGVGVLLADNLCLRGARIAGLSAALMAQLRPHLAPYADDLNPVCLEGDVDPEGYVEVVRRIVESGEADTVMVLMVLHRVSAPGRVVERLRALAAAKRVDLIYIWHGNRADHGAAANRLVARGEVIYQSVEEAATAYCYAMRYFDNLANVVAVPPRFDHSLSYRRGAAAEHLAELWRATGLTARHHREGLLEAYGVPVNSTRITASLAEAMGAVVELGVPVALRAETEPDGYGPGSASVWVKEDLPGAYRRLARGGERVSVQRIVRDVRYEVKLGARTDPEFGPYLFLGPGGPMAVAAGEEAVILPPLNRMLAGRLVAKSGLAERLDLDPEQREQLEEILVRVSQLVVDVPAVRELEINPLTLSRDGFLVQASALVLEDRGVSSPQHLVTAPYPNQYEFRERLKDGTAVLIRPIRPEDGESHYAFIRGLSSRTLYNRFFGFRRDISPKQMVRFTQIDYDREVAIVARVEQGDGEVTIGVNRLTFDPRGQRYEFAVVVADAWQGTGIGRLLMEKIVEIAADRGIDTIYGMILAANHRMQTLARKIGFTVLQREEDVVIVRLEVPAAPALEPPTDQGS